MDWTDIDYLQRGNERQRRAFRVLTDLRIMALLRDYTPVLTGTIPIQVDIASSDLDIICEAHNLRRFALLLEESFGGLPGFCIKEQRVRGIHSLVSSFSADDWPIEIFAQPQPVVQQNAYRHMLVEARLLEIGGEPARQEIRRLKETGVKTEPAFASYFALVGDPYDALLEIADLDAGSLRKRFA